jgi:hypothetical protein
MSTKIDCVIYLKSKLESEFTKLWTGKTPNIPAAQKIQRLVLTAENISDGYFAKIEPFYEPVSPKFMLMVNVSAGTLNPHLPKRTIAAAQILECFEE